MSTVGSWRARVKAWMVRLALRFVVWAQKDSPYIRHLRAEVPNWFTGDGPDRWIAEGTEQLLAVLSTQGHSGSSFGFAIKFFVRVASFKPWGPLTGEEAEWSEPYDDKGTRQNRRRSSVFMDANGEAYDIDARVFHDGDHHYYSNSNSRLPITFPYTPPDNPIVVDTTLEHP